MHIGWFSCTFFVSKLKAKCNDEVSNLSAYFQCRSSPSFFFAEKRLRGENIPQRERNYNTNRVLPVLKKKKKCHWCRLSLLLLYSLVCRNSAANKSQSYNTIKELKPKDLDDSTHLCAAGSNGGRGRAANAYLRRETAKFRISQSSTSLLFLSPYKLAWMCSLCFCLFLFFVGVKIRFFFSPQWSLACAAPLICMHAWIRILCVPSNSGASVCLHR